MTSTVTNIALAPLLPLWLVVPFALVAAALLIYGLVRSAPGTLWRALALAALVVALLNPSIVRERREALPDVALVVVDHSSSQTIAGRPAQTDKALKTLLERLHRLGNLDVRVVQATPAMAAGEDGLPGSGTRLFGVARRALADVPRSAVSALILITDGEVHDAPKTMAQLGYDAPVQVLLTGQHQEVDRRLELIDAPRYGIVGKPVTIVFRVHDSVDGSGTVPVTLTTPDGQKVTHEVPVGKRYEMRFTLNHAGRSVVRLDVAPRPGELTDINNSAVLAINGIRENLKVLLISGEVHNGERVWRNSLKSDPSVELVHFTILRPPEKQDNTPIRELSLISFPVRQLFEERLHDFDLIIFDRYRKRGVIPEEYLQNIVNYVTGGGAMLIAAGPDFATRLSLADTALGQLMPAKPTGKVLIRGFHVMPTDLGRRHPVTAGLPGVQDKVPPWGRWFRQIDTVANRGDVLLTGIDNKPLLVLARAGKGRVAELLSDQIWLWARGYEGGGPSQELLRRLAHWLMKEPELEANAIRASATGNTIHIVRQSLKDRPAEVTLVSPTGTSRTVTLKTTAPGRATADVKVGEAGVYKVSDGDLHTVVAVGELNPLEWRDPRATTRLLSPVIDASGGSFTWIADGRLPSVRRVEPGRVRSGDGWIGVLDHGRYIVRGIDTLALMPPWLALMLLVGGLAAAWRAEGR